MRGKLVILLTGPTSAVGKELAAALAADAAGEACLIRLATRDPARIGSIGPGFETVRMDYDDPESVQSALQGVERAFLATGPSIAMLRHSKCFLDIAKEQKVEQIVHLGATVEPEQPFDHLIWHSYVTAYIAQMGFAYADLQPRTFMQNVLNGLRPGKPKLRHFYGGARVTWADPFDIAAMARAALMDPARHNGKTYRIATVAATMDEIARTLAHETGIEFEAHAMDNSEMRSGLERLGMEPVYAASLSKAVGMIAAETIPNYSTLYDPLPEVIGRPGRTWTDFAQAKKEQIKAKLEA